MMRLYKIKKIYFNFFKKVVTLARRDMFITKSCSHMLICFPKKNMLIYLFFSRGLDGVGREAHTAGPNEAQSGSPLFRFLPNPIRPSVGPLARGDEGRPLLLFRKATAAAAACASSGMPGSGAKPPPHILH